MSLGLEIKSQHKALETQVFLNLKIALWPVISVIPGPMKK